MPLTTTATMVEIPATSRTGSGRLDPEPCPRPISGKVNIQLGCSVCHYSEGDDNSGCGQLNNLE